MSRRQDMSAPGPASHNGSGAPTNVDLSYLDRRRNMRLFLVAMIPLAPAGYLVGKSHGVPVAVAAVLGLACFIGAIGLFVAWPPRPSRRANQLTVALLIVSFWPSPVWPAWTFFAGLLGGGVLLGMWMSHSERRSAIELDRIVGGMTPESQQHLADVRQELAAPGRTPMHPFRRRR